MGKWCKISFIYLALGLLVFSFLIYIHLSVSIPLVASSNTLLCKNPYYNAYNTSRLLVQPNNPPKHTHTHTHTRARKRKQLKKQKRTTTTTTTSEQNKLMNTSLETPYQATATVIQRTENTYRPMGAFGFRQAPPSNAHVQPAAAAHQTAQLMSSLTFPCIQSRLA